MCFSEAQPKSKATAFLSSEQVEDSISLLSCSKHGHNAL